MVGSAPLGGAEPTFLFGDIRPEREEVPVRTTVTSLYIMVVDQGTGGKIHEKLVLDRTLRRDNGPGNSGCDYISDGSSSVPCGISADRLRLRLYAKVRKGGRYEDCRCEVPEISERDFEENL